MQVDTLFKARIQKNKLKCVLNTIANESSKDIPKTQQPAKKHYQSRLTVIDTLEWPILFDTSIIEAP